MARLEYARMYGRRDLGLTQDDVRALEALDASTMCAECHWQRAETLSRHRLLCGNCAEVERIWRSVEATATRLRRRDRAAGG